MTIRPELLDELRKRLPDPAGPVGRERDHQTTDQGDDRTLLAS